MKYKFGDIVYVHFRGHYEKAVVIKIDKETKNLHGGYHLALEDDGAVVHKFFAENELIGEKEYEENKRQG